MKIGILTMELHENREKNTVGSSRIRGSWLVKHWPEAELFKIGQKYDAIIFQKVYFLRFLKNYKGIKILDLCDPDWLEGKPIKETIDLCDAVTVSSKALQEFICQMTDKPVIFIPDRMDPESHTIKKQHKGRAQKVVWFGYAHNHRVIDSALATIKRLGLKLTIISDLPYHPGSNIGDIDNEWISRNVTNIKYDYDSINEEIVNGGDIVINPKIDTGKFKYKSDNKTYTAWMLGMPVATDSAELEKLMDQQARIQEADKRLSQAQNELITPLSVAQYKDLITKLQHK